MLDFTGKVALVTGGGRGIGEAISRLLASRGAKVAVCDVNLAAAAEVRGQIAAGGGAAEAIAVDITVRDQVYAAVRAVQERLGPVDILVNNAGWEKVESFVESREETWERILSINLRGPITVTRAVLDQMIERRRGRICSVASDAGRVGSSGEAVYSAAKGGIVAFSKTLAREMARFGIGVNCVSPGPTDTPLTREVLAANPKFVAALERLIPFGRLGRPEEIAAAVVFLVSDEAGYITGQVLSVNGGLNMV
jgi:2-hydroxycyclohexanecarboxyl-CoA dehydrogenase